MKFLSPVLSFFNLLDSQGNLSITNLLVLGGAVQFGVQSYQANPSWSGAATLIAAVANYAAKRSTIASQASVGVSAQSKALDAMAAQLEALHRQQAETHAIAKATESKASALALQSGLTRNQS